MLSRTLSEEIVVKATAAEAWKVYGTLQLDYILLKKLSHCFQNIEILQGNGGVGTMIKVTLCPAPTYQIEKFTVVDDVKRLKIAEIIEGGYLAQGFTKFRFLLQVLEKDEKTCITRVTVEYEMGEDVSDKVPFEIAKVCVAVLNAVADNLTNTNEALVLDT